MASVRRGVAAEAPRSSTARAGRAGALLPALAIFLLALVPRTIGLGRFLTPDEATGWMVWAEWFAIALRQGDFASTVYVGHPGVTTLWLGALGTQLHAWLVAAGLLDPSDTIARAQILRLPAGLATAACVGLAYPALRRLLGARTALLAALLWAADPFSVALSQLLHIDGLLSALCMLALLWAMCAFRLDQPPAPAAPARPRRGWLLAAGVAAGLALLTKSPALSLAPLTALIALAGARRMERAGPGGWLAAARHALGPLAVWAGAAALTWAALWPLVWVDPLRALAEVAGEAIQNGGRPHESGNFFLGAPVAAPDARFYPVALALRLTPWTLLGLLLAGLWAARGLGRRGRPLADGRALALALLAAFTLLWVGAFSLLAKKHDRYMLAAVPPICALAAHGWVWATAGLRARLGRAGERAAWGAAVAGLAANLAAYHPYELTYYSPLLGGGPAAQAAIPVGWGEGHELAMQFVRGRPDTCALPLAVWMYEIIPPAERCPEMAGIDDVADPRNRIGYVILSSDNIQRNTYPAAMKRLEGLRPLHTVRLHGVELARVYQLPRSVDMLVNADFGPAIRLRGFGYDQSGLRAGAGLALELQWQAGAAPTGAYTLAARLLDAAGAPVAKIDVPPAGPERPTPSWLPNELLDRLQPLPAPADLPAGRYWLALTLYDPATMARLPLSGPAPGANAPPAGADELIIGPLDLR